MTNDIHPGRLERVLRSPKSSAALTLGALLLAFVWVNSPYASAYETVHHAPATVTIAGFELAKPMILWINEGLTVFFFFLIGLEIKREVLEGQLSSPSQIALPAFAAIGGREFLHQVEHDLTPWVALLIVPLFAFFNAGIALEGMTIETLLSPVSLGVVLGLFLGKPLGVTAGAGLAVATGLGRLPPDVGWPQICGVALLAGVGFTMSLFVAALAFEGPGAVLSVNLGVVIESALSATAGLAVPARATRSGSNTEREEATV